MAAKPKPMSQIKQILRLYYQQKKSIKFIVRNLEVSRNTVRKYLALQQASGKSITELLALDDPELHKMLLPGKETSEAQRYRELADRYDDFKEELKRPGVTRWRLWSEYRQSHPGGYSYSQFCWHLQQLGKADQVTMSGLPHPPGEHLYVDFAGIKMEYVDPDSGQIHSVPVFVATLGMSQYSYVEAVASQRTEDFLSALANALRYFGGVPKLIIPDNLKAAVIKSDRYEPRLNKLLEDFANHYQTSVLPARPLRPQDKSLVETAVREAYRNIYAPLRNRQFFSLGEINEAIRSELCVWSERPFQDRSDTRIQLFEQFERPALGCLPDEPFQIKKSCSLTVRQNTHIKLGEDRHYYSVPYTYIGHSVQVIYTPQLVQIYCKQELVASHHRDRTPFEYTTVNDHLPSHHQHWLERSPGWYRNRAEYIGPEVLQLVNAIFARRRHPEQAYSSCDGILALSRKVGKDQLIRAARIALELNEPTYTFVKRLLNNGMDTYRLPADSTQSKLPGHKNIRGKSGFQKSLKL